MLTGYEMTQGEVVTFTHWDFLNKFLLNPTKISKPLRLLGNFMLIQ